MANYNYGVNCPSGKIAEKLFVFVSMLDLYQDGLDIDGERIMLISTQALKDELENYAKTISGGLVVEIWPEHSEYDEAAEKGKLEVYEFAGKGGKKSGAADSPLKFKVYSGEEALLADFRKWLDALKRDDIKITHEWRPEGEWGSYGIEFVCSDAKFDKLINKEWSKKGVVAEKIT